MPRGVYPRPPKTVCLIPDCTRKVAAYGLCSMHRRRVLNHGSTEKPSRQEPIQLRIWRRVDKNGPMPEFRQDIGRCWLWTGNLNSNGYGTVGEGGTYGRSLYVHRVLWEAENGPVPLDLELDHLCRVRQCVRTSHLEAVTHQENMARSAPAALPCKRGHPRTAENTYVSPSGRRMCEPCRQERMRTRGSGFAETGVGDA